MAGQHHALTLFGLIGSCLLTATAIFAVTPSPVSNIASAAAVGPVIPNLPDGSYQFCTEPAPQDWHDGAGVCLNFSKQGSTIDGYYGYPHSDEFVCLRGIVSDELLDGKGLVISWAGSRWSEIPKTEFKWDKEGRLSLSQGAIADRQGIGEDQISWIIFQTAKLNMQGLHPYKVPRMTAIDQLCNWNFDSKGD